MQTVIPIIDIVISMSSAIDLISPNISNHHKRVAYISYNLGKEINLNEDEIKDLVLAALLHDCGAANYLERHYIFELGFDNSMLQRHSHGYKGWFILHDAPELKNAAEIIKFHHTFWNERNEVHMSKYNIPLASHILHLADRIDILINRNDEILKQRGFINNIINSKKGIMFMPEAVEAFDNLMDRTSFWFDIVSPYLENIIRDLMLPYMVSIDSSSFVNYSNIAHRIIDFRSQFTATHSTGVATSAKALSIKMGFDSSESEWMYCAGLVHDLGKLCIPESILEKKGALDSDELNLIKRHPYYTYRILNSIPGLEKVRDWAAFHHEKLDGKGYPFNKRASELDLGARILAVSDIFTALAEDRPYREAMPLEMALKTVNNIKTLDYDVKVYLNNNIEEINQARKLSQESAIINCTEMYKSGDQTI